MLPTIKDHIDDPNLIAYFQHDEAYLMDLIWYYFSGEKRASYQDDSDYGLEMVYLSDFAKLFLSPFIELTPGDFVLMLRGLHFLGWVLALLALWRFMSRHFNSWWQQSLIVMLLGVRPAFAYVVDNSKPEPLVLLLMVLGLDYTLRIIDSPAKKHILGALVFACLALLVKFSGIFLIPAIISAVSISCWSRLKIIAHIPWFSIFLFLAGVFLILLVIVPLSFYVRLSTGQTFIEELGLWRSLLKLKLPLILYFMGGFAILFSFVLYLFNRNTGRCLIFLNKVSFVSLVIGFLFLSLICVLGFRWFLDPQYFLKTYFYFGSQFFKLEASPLVSGKHFFYLFFEGFFHKIISLDILIFLLFCFYLFFEFHLKKVRHQFNDKPFIKRMVLLAYLTPLLLFLLIPGRMSSHNLLPFFVMFCVLALQGIHLLPHLMVARYLKQGFVAMVALLITFDIVSHGYATVKERLYVFKRSEDVVFEISQWWRGHISPEEAVVTDHMTRVYVPPGHKNIRVFRGHLTNRLEQLRSIVKESRPRYLYYNEGPSGDKAFPTIDLMLPNQRVKLVKLFETEGRQYQRYQESRFLIYELIY